MTTEIFSYPEIKFIIGFIFTFSLGFLIGHERSKRAKPAGARTYILVATGSMLFTLLSMNMDLISTSRIASNVVTGIGFLGAGIIMHHKGSVQGLTTAASIWFVAAIGMAIGFGWYSVGVIATLTAFFTLKLPEEWKKHKNRNLDLDDKETII